MPADTPSLLIISFSRLVADARVLKQIEEFRTDFAVTTCGYGPSPDGTVNHIQLPEDAVYWRYDRLKVVTRQFTNAYWGNPAVTAANRALGGLRFDAVLANDIDTAGLALSLGARNGVHLDLHEYSPMQNTELLRFRLFVAPFMRWQLRTFAAKARSTSTVCQSIADRYRDEFGFKPLVVTNAAPYAELKPRTPIEPIRLVHAGAALPNRRLETLIEGTKDCGDRFTLDLYLTPNVPAYYESLVALAEPHPHITVQPAVAYSDLLVTLNQYDVGVHILAPTNYNNRVALPNKFFDFVQARLGLIVGPSPEMEHLLRENQLGIVTETFSARSLSDALATLNVEQVAGWKANAHKHARSLSAEAQVAIWRRAVEQLFSA